MLQNTKYERILEWVVNHNVSIFGNHNSIPGSNKIHKTIIRHTNIQLVKQKKGHLHNLHVGNISHLLVWTLESYLVAQQHVKHHVMIDLMFIHLISAQTHKLQWSINTRYLYNLLTVTSLDYSVQNVLTFPWHVKNNSHWIFVLHSLCHEPEDEWLVNMFSAQIYSIFCDLLKCWEHLYFNVWVVNMLMLCWWNMNRWLFTQMLLILATLLHCLHLTWHSSSRILSQHCLCLLVTSAPCNPVSQWTRAVSWCRMCGMKVSLVSHVMRTLLNTALWSHNTTI